VAETSYAKCCDLSLAYRVFGDGPIELSGEAIVRADLDLAQIAEGKYDLDVVGHYARPDIFQLSVNERPMPPVVMSTMTRPGPPPADPAR
jgi:hypothetical protein